MIFFYQHIELLKLASMIIFVCVFVYSWKKFLFFLSFRKAINPSFYFCLMIFRWWKLFSCMRVYNVSIMLFYFLLGWCEFCEEIMWYTMEYCVLLETFWYLVLYRIFVMRKKFLVLTDFRSSFVSSVVFVFFFIS